MSVKSNIPDLMESSKLMMAHIATEVIVIGGISFFFHKKIAELNAKVVELEKKLEKCGPISGGIPEEQFGQFQQQTTQHINNIYGAIRQITNAINGSVPTSENRDSDMRDERMKAKDIKRKNNSQINFSLTPENTTENSKIEVIEEEKILDEVLDDELKDELKDLSGETLVDTCENSIKNEENNTSQETLLEFIPNKGKKLVKKKK